MINNKFMLNGVFFWGKFKILKNKVNLQNYMYL